MVRILRDVEGLMLRGDETRIRCEQAELMIRAMPQ